MSLIIIPFNTLMMNQQKSKNKLVTTEKKRGRKKESIEVTKKPRIKQQIRTRANDTITEKCQLWQTLMEPIGVYFQNIQQLQLASMFLKTKIQLKIAPSEQQNLKEESRPIRRHPELPLIRIPEQSSEEQSFNYSFEVKEEEPEPIRHQGTYESIFLENSGEDGVEEQQSNEKGFNDIWKF